MKVKFKKILLSLACSLICTSVIGLSAVNMTPELTITTDKDEYSNGEEIKVDVSLKNGTDSDIKDISINSEIPEDLKLKEGNIEYSTDLLSKGDSLSFSYTLTDSDDTEVIDPDDGQDDETNKEENSSEKVTNVDCTDKTKSINTGDDDYSYLIMIFVLSFIIITGLTNKKIRKRFFVILVAGALISTCVSNIYAVNDSNSEYQSHVVSEKMIKIDGIEYTIKSNATYQNIAQEYVTRGEWINTLVEKMNYTIIDFNQIEPYFSDTLGTSVEKNINYAVAYQIIDLNSDKFYPDEYATREFIAETTVNALGFVTDKEIECLDSSSIVNKKDVYLAVDLGIIDLIDGYFYPNDFATTQITEQALNIVTEVLKSTNVSDAPIVESKFKDNVISIDSDKINISNGIITSDESVLDDINIGDLLSISETEVYKITDKHVQDGQTVLSVSVPQIEEVYSELHMEGTATADFNDFIPADGVTVGVTETEVRARMSQVTPEFKKTMDFTLDLTDQIKIKGKIGADLATTYDFTLGESDKFLILYDKLETEVGIYIGDNEVIEGDEIKKLIEQLKNKDDEDGAIEGSMPLGSIPIGSTPVVVDFELEYTAEGYLKIVNNYNGKIGGQIYNGHARFISDINNEKTVEFGGKLNLGIDVIGAIKVLDNYILDVSAGLGLAGEGTLDLRSNGMICNGIQTYIYLNMKFMDHTDWDDLLFNFELEQEIWNSKNSPFPLSVHWENGSIVKDCTYVPFFAGGDGSEENPYQVSTPEQLNAVRDNLNAHYIQINDIDLSTFGNWDPIGYINQLAPDTSSNLFTGVYNGDNYSITGLTITERSNYATLGLFGFSSGEIKNVKLKNIDIDVDKSHINYPEQGRFKVHVGAICAYNWEANDYKNGIITNCSVDGYINVTNVADCDLGGITGASGEITNCTNYADIKIVANRTNNDRYDNDNIVNCGGISAGPRSIIRNCVNYGDIDAHSGNYLKCGGISGVDSNNIDYCINYGNISGQTDSYYTYSMFGPSNCTVGGIVGHQANGGTAHVINYGDVFGLASSTASCSVGGISGAQGYSGYVGWLGDAFNYGKNIECFIYKKEYDEMIKIHSFAGRIYGSLSGSIDRVVNLHSVNYSIVNDEVLVDDGSQSFSENGAHGLTLTKEQMDEKSRYILEELGIEQ